MQLCFQLVLCAVGAQSVFCGEPGLLVESVPGQGFPSFLVVHSGQVFCNCVSSVKGQIACQLTLVFGGLFPMCQVFFLIIWFGLWWWWLCVVVGVVVDGGEVGGRGDGGWWRRGGVG